MPRILLADKASTTTGTTIVSEEIGNVPIQLSGTNRTIRDYMTVLPGVKDSAAAGDVNNHALLDGVGDAEEHARSQDSEWTACLQAGVLTRLYLDILDRMSGPILLDISALVPSRRVYH